MADHLTREEMRRDEVGEALERGVEYVATNWKRILTAAALLGLAIVAGAAWIEGRARAAKRASYALTEAVNEISAAPQQAATQLDAVIAKGGEAARVARLYRATLPEADAETLWQQASGSEMDAVTVVATINRLDGLRRSASWDEALQLLQGEVTLPDDLRLYQRALTLAGAGRTDELASTVDELGREHPRSPWTAEARALQVTG